MRLHFKLAAVLTLASITTALAQAPQQPNTAPAPKPSVEQPIDKGPYTPAANEAYQGGGVVLQGAPGAPAPKPQATPPGLTPQNAVPR